LLRNSETYQRPVDVRVYPEASSMSINDLSRSWALKDVNDHLNGATHDRRNGAISKWPKSGSQSGLKLVFFTPFQRAVFGRFSTCAF
jgi:hypothetical protein